MNYLFIKKHWVGIVIAIVIIALLFLGNIDAIWTWVSSWKAETVMIATAIASIVIATCALVATTVQGMQNRKHNRLSVKPYLKLINNITERGNKRFINLELENCGTGPAIIKNFILEFDGKEIARNDIKKYETFLAKNTSGLTFSNICFMGSNNVIKEGTKQPLWKFKYECGSQEDKFIGGLNMRIEYQSIYKDEIFIWNLTRGF